MTCLTEHNRPVTLLVLTVCRRGDIRPWQTGPSPWLLRRVSGRRIFPQMAEVRFRKISGSLPQNIAAATQFSDFPLQFFETFALRDGESFITTAWGPFVLTKPGAQGAAAATDYFREPVRQNALKSNISLLKIAGRKLLRASCLQSQAIPATFVRNFASSVSEYYSCKLVPRISPFYFLITPSRSFRSEFYVFILIILNCPQPYFV